MAFEGLTEKLNATFKKLRGKGRLTENDVREAMREVRLALLEADVGYKVVKDFVATVTERAVGSDVLDSLTPAQQVDLEAAYSDWYFFNSNGEIDNPTGTFANNIKNGYGISPVQYAYYQRATGEIDQAQLDKQLGELRKNNFAKQYGEEALRHRVLQPGVPDQGGELPDRSAAGKRVQAERDPLPL